MQKSYRKNIRRGFRSDLNRFLSLFGIVALGVMMLTGLVSFAPSMRTAGQKYYVQQNVFDLRVLSTLGLSESDPSIFGNTTSSRTKEILLTCCSSISMHFSPLSACRT